MALDTVGLLVDFNADDLTGATGSAVTTWTDSVGGYVAAQATSGKQPTLRTATLNGHNLVEFDGVSDTLPWTTGLGLTQNRASLAVFVVYRLPSVAVAGVQQLLSFSTGTSSSAARAALYTSGSAGKPQLAGRRLDADAFQGLQASNALLTGHTGILAARFLWSTGAAYLYQDGMTVASSVAFQTAGSTSNTPALAAAIGARSDGLTTELFAGSIARILIYTDADDTKRAGIEAYLNSVYSVKWNSGAGMPAVGGVNRVASGAFNVWRGGVGKTPIAMAWQDVTYSTAATGSDHLATGGTYASWTGSMDLTIGGLWSAANGGNGGVTDTWAMAAAGTLDARWTTILNNIKTKWESNSSRIAARATLYLRFCHELNANWYDWQVRTTEVADFITGWRRFYALKQSIFPAAKLVFNTIAEKNGNEYNWTTLWPGDGYVDVLSTDYYGDAYKHVFIDGGAVNDSLGGPRTLEGHRAFAASHSVPMGISEWGVDPVFGSGDDPNLIQYVYDFCNLNGGVGPGKLLYEGYFNESKSSTDRHALYVVASEPTANGDTVTEFPLAAARYQSIFARLASARAQVIRAELKSQPLPLRGRVIRAELRSNAAPSTVRGQVVRAEMRSADVVVVRGQVISATLNSDFIPFMQISDNLTAPSKARVSLSSLYRGNGTPTDYNWVCTDPTVVLQPNGRFCVVDLPAVKTARDFIIQVRGVLDQSVTAFSACTITVTRHLVWAGINGVLEPIGARKFVQGSAPLDPDPNPPPVPDNTAPSTPGGLSASVSGQLVSLSWVASTDNVGIDHYEVHRSTTSGFTVAPTTKLANVLTGVSYADSGVPAGTWYYRVVAVDAAGNASAAAVQVQAVVAAVGGTPSPGLWFQALPSGFGSRKAMPHLFLSPFAISIQNDPAPDYWDKNWLTPAVEGTSDYRPIGGYVRDKPLDAYQDARPQPTATWRAQDAEQMVKQAMDHGLDGFWAEMLGSIGSQSQVRNAAAATAADKLAPDGSFKIGCMPDFNNSTWLAQTADQSADQMAVFAFTNTPVRGGTNTRRPSGFFLPDGRMLVSCFMGDNMTVAKWQAIFDSMFTGYGVRLALMNVLSTFANRSAFAGFQYGSSSWGAGGDPNIARTMQNQTAISHAAGEKAMVSIWPADIRPAGNVVRAGNTVNDAGLPPGTGNVGLYDEALNTEALRAYWDKAISEGTDYTQLTTWSDFREGGMSMGTVGQGHVVQAISAWYSYKWKTGAFPPILVDCAIISHRNQPFPTPFTYRYDASGLYTRKMAHWDRGPNTSALRNNVEALTFLTAPATVTVRSGATTRTYTAPAGMFADAGLPLAMGAQSVTVTRGGVTVASITSPVVATATPFNQNPYYYKASSCELPEWFSKQRDPTANL